MKTKSNLVNIASFAENHYSQSGEDGILLQALEMLKNNNKSKSDPVGFVCEVGAWDGKHLSNTFNLISNYKYGSVLIECDKRKFNELIKNTKPFDNQFLFNAFVNLQGNSTLDAILGKTTVPKEFDLLSIDIDGMDYYIWESLQKYSPKLVIIEFNPTMPRTVEFIQKNDFNLKHGSSAAALIKLGKIKGYLPIAATHCNIIFMKERFTKSLGIDTKIWLEKFYNQFSTNSVWVFSGYNGEIISNQEKIHLPWHGLTVNVSKLQVLPQYLQKYPHDYSRIQKVYAGLYINIKNYGLKGVYIYALGIIESLIGKLLNLLSPNQRKFIRKIKNYLS